MPYNSLNLMPFITSIITLIITIIAMICLYLKKDVLVYGAHQYLLLHFVRIIGTIYLEYI